MKGLVVDRMRAAIGLMILVLLSGCTALGSHPTTRTWQQLRGGMTFVLHQPVTIPAERSSLVIQDGEVIHGGASRYRPFCELIVDRLVDRPLLIEPDHFTIEQVRGQTRFTRRDAVPIRLAVLASFRLASSGDDSLPPDVTETWRMRLHSPRQPHVILLICGGEEDNLERLAEPPTLAQMRAALGSVASLQ